MPRITIDGVSRAFPEGTQAGEMFDAAYPGRTPRPVAASVHGRIPPAELGARGRLHADAD